MTTRQTASSSHKTYQQAFSVSYEYPVHFTRGIFNPDNALLASVFDRLGEGRRHRVMVYIDSGVVAANPDFPQQVSAYLARYSDKLLPAETPQIIAGGEKAKTGWTQVREIMTALGNLHMCRQSFVLAIGGGSVLDMVGFAASLVHRGLRIIRIPTTVLGQNDAGVGVKNGMDEHGSKNYVGVFSPPFAVINDFDFLSTLSTEDWTGGIAEAFKVAIIKDADFFGFLAANAVALHNREPAPMEELVRRCAVLHLDHIRSGGDPFEFGAARPLDFGHWCGHRIEVLSGYKTGHGYAVAVGIALDSFYAMKTGLISAEELESILDAMSACGLPLYNDLIELKTDAGKYAILEGIDQFREHLGGRLTITMPAHIGNRQEIHEMNTAVIEAGIAFLKLRHEGRARK